MSGDPNPIRASRKSQVGFEGGTTLWRAVRAIRIPRMMAALAVSLAMAGAVRAQTSPTLADFGATAPTPGPDDQYQLTTGGGNPPGLNRLLNYSPDALNI